MQSSPPTTNFGERMPVNVNGRVISVTAPNENSPEYKKALDIAFRARLLEEWKMLEDFLSKQKQAERGQWKMNPGGVY
jgi:hypothetical protein